LRFGALVGTLGLKGGLALGSPPLGGPSSSEELNSVPYKKKACEIKWLRTNLSLVLLMVTKHSYTLPMFSSNFGRLSISLSVHNAIQCKKFQGSTGMHGKEVANV